MSFSQLLPDFVQLVVGERRVARLLERAQRALIRVATEARHLPGRVGRVASRVSLRYIGARDRPPELSLVPPAPPHPAAPRWRSRGDPHSRPPPPQPVRRLSR